MICAYGWTAGADGYYAPPKNKDETHWLESIEQILLRFPFYGYRKLHKTLRRQGIVIGEHRVRRLLRQLGITRSVGKVRVQTTDSHHPHPRYPNRIKGQKLTLPDQVWVADITSARCGRTIDPNARTIAAIRNVPFRGAALAERQSSFAFSVGFSAPVAALGCFAASHTR